MTLNPIDALNWRYATKKFDPTKQVSGGQFQTILDAAVLSPSSLGLQPYRFIVVDNPALRAQMRVAGNDQPQITDAHKLIVIATPKHIDERDVARFIKQVSKIQGTPIEKLGTYQAKLNGALAGRGQTELPAWMAKQAYIALGIMIETAALLGIDTCPMEGFNKKEMDVVLGLEALGLEAHALLAVGYRAADDPAATRVKVRFGREDLIIQR